MPTLIDALRLLQVVLLAVALPLSIIAARGYWNAPFGAVLKPLPVVTVGFLVTLATRFLPLSPGGALLVQALAWTVAVVAVCWASLQFVLVTTEQKVLST